MAYNIILKSINKSVACNRHTVDPRFIEFLKFLTLIYHMYTLISRSVVNWYNVHKINGSITAKMHTKKKM